MSGVQKATVLLAEHKELGAKLTEFGGWQMPLQYRGIIAEHEAVRNFAGLFDVSHLGKLRIVGAGATEALQRTVTVDVNALAPGQASYALVLADDAGCIDDIFIYRVGGDEWLIVPNASNVEAVARALSESGTTPIDEWDRYSILALQGPTSYDVFDKVWPDSGATELKLHHWSELDVGGRPGMVARTGYTGERGFEIYAPTETSTEAFRALLEAGAEPVGLGARDTLRLEMGYALYGHEIDRSTNPLEAGLGWVISWDSPFRGREALLRIKERGPRRKLFGIVLADRGVPRQGYEVTRDGGDVIGTIVSGNHSPTLKTGIALAYGETGSLPQEGDEVAISGRHRLMRGDIVKPPFIKKR